MTALATTDPNVCPQCDPVVELAEFEVEQDALFIHGGYGATGRTVQVTCPECGWSMVREQSEVRPPRKDPT